MTKLNPLMPPPSFTLALLTPGAETAFGVVISSERPCVSHRIAYSGRQWIVLASKVDDAIGSSTEGRTPPAAQNFQNVTRPPNSRWVYTTVIPDFHHETWPPVQLPLVETK